MQKMLQNIIFTAIYSLVGTIHLIGLLLLYKAKNCLPNQRLLTMNLAIAEMVICWGSVAQFNLTPVHDQIGFIIYYAFGIMFLIEIRLTMLHIIFDRFLEIYMNIKYPLIMTHRNITVLVGAHWTLSVIWTIIEFTLNVVSGHMISRMFAFFSCLILDIIILISFLVTYSYFYSRVKKIRHLESNSVSQCTQNRQRSLFKKFNIHMLQYQ